MSILLSPKQLCILSWPLFCVRYLRKALTEHRLRCKQLLTAKTFRTYRPIGTALMCTSGMMAQCVHTLAFRDPPMANYLRRVQMSSKLDMYIKTLFCSIPDDAALCVVEKATLYAWDDI